MADWVAPPELIRTLPLKRALVIRGNLDPVAVRFRPWWTRIEVRVRRVTGATLRPPRPVAVPAGRHPGDVETEVREILHLVPADDGPRVAGGEPEAATEDDIIG